MMEINGYLYETHMHTAEASACAKSSGAEMARAYRKAGYTGVVVTDHFFYGNTAIDRSLAWEEWVTQFCKGYESVKAEGDKIGLSVFFGWESGYQGTEFLIYGLDKEWLLAHPKIREADIEEQYKLVHEGGGIVCHAHPFREEPYIPQIRLFPEYVDAVEGINATHESPVSSSHLNPDFNRKACAYAKEHHLPITAGSDQHTTLMIGGGMLFERKLRDAADFCKAVCKSEAIAYWDGYQFYPQFTRSL